MVKYNWRGRGGTTANTYYVNIALLGLSSILNLATKIKRIRGRSNSCNTKVDITTTFMSKQNDNTNLNTT